MAKAKDTPELLKLTALDEEDLAVISAHLQDALVRVGDISYLADEQRFALVLNRFDWDHALRADGGEGYRRRRSGLHFERVRAARSRGIPRRRRDAVLELLSIGFEPGDAPSGAIELAFAGGGTIRLEVECIEARISDLGPVWRTRHRPRHELGEEAG